MRTYTKKELAESKGLLRGRNFWNVSPSGDYGKDCETGYTYGAMTYAYMKANRPYGGTLGTIVLGMMKSDADRDKGLIVGFFSFFDGVSACTGEMTIGYLMFNQEIARASMALHFLNGRKKKNLVPYTWAYQDKNYVASAAQ